jgi:hypothetical protein
MAWFISRALFERSTYNILLNVQEFLRTMKIHYYGKLALLVQYKGRKRYI